MSVSVLSVVYGGAAPALRAYADLRERTGRELQLIVVDNASPDGAGALLRARLRDAQLILNDRNVGVGNAMNQAAEAATGEVIVFLNPDAHVHEGWLDPLLARLHTDPRGAAAPLLLNRDGTVQEAGSFVSGDGHTIAIGSGDEYHTSAHLFARLADFASTACLAMRRARFEEIGGFDPRYHLAYFDDTDLCFEIARGGGRVWFEPHSVVTHAKGGSTPTARAAELFQLNRPRFVEKWSSTLAARPTDAGSIAPHVARDWHAGCRVLLDGYRGSDSDDALGALAARQRAVDPTVVLTVCNVSIDRQRAVRDRFGVEALTAPRETVESSRPMHYSEVISIG